MNLTLTGENWQSRGNCRDTDPEVMQPEVATEQEVEDAKAICRGCPVLQQCKALAHSQRHTTTNTNAAYGVHAGKWFGPPPAHPNVLESVLPDDRLRELLEQGWSIRKLAAEYRVSTRQVRNARSRVLAA